MSTDEKLLKLRERLKGLKSVLVAYSGGADSSFLLKVASEVLKGRLLAVVAVSETYTGSELTAARRLAKRLSVPVKVIKTRELQDRRFRENPQDRCYYCKTELFSKLKEVASESGLRHVVDGSNKDDLSDYRPGARAKKRFKVISPLQEAGFTKEEVRQASKKMRLSTWNKPALACLASRFPYGSPITKKGLARVQKAEAILRRMARIRGNLRVRDFGDSARIEADLKESGKLQKTKVAWRSRLKRLGYLDVEIDPKGYRCGSLNEGIVKS